MKNFLAGIFFAFVPALFAGLSFALIHPMLGLIAGIGMFGFGLDVCFRGSDQEPRP